MSLREGLALASAAAMMCGGAFGGVQDVPVEAGAPPTAQATAQPTGQPTAQADRGRGGEFEAVRFSLSGGRPFSPAVLVVESEVGGAAHWRIALPVILDGSGNAARTVRETDPGEVLRGRFVMRSGRDRPWVSSRLSGPSTQKSQVFQRGDLVITEFMKDPSAVPDNKGEWIELYNTTTHPINIEGWTLSDAGSNSHTFDNGKQLIVIPAGGYRVIGNNADPATNGGVIVHHQYSGFTLANGADSILLTSRSGKLVDRVDYDDGIFWPDLPGQSISLNPASTNPYKNDRPFNWCHSTTLMFPVGIDTGTPSALNDTCP